MIGMTDPVNSKPEKTLKWLRALNIEERIYPAESYDPEDEDPPVCIFVPEPNLMNKMIETCAKNPHDTQLINSKFSCLDQPKPQWLIDDQKMKSDRIKEEMKLLGLDTVTEGSASSRLTDSDAEQEEKKE